MDGTIFNSSGNKGGDVIMYMQHIFNFNSRIKNGHITSTRATVTEGGELRVKYILDIQECRCG